MVAWGRRLRDFKFHFSGFYCVGVACYVTMVAWCQSLRACWWIGRASVCVDVACYVTMVAEASTCELVDWLAVFLPVWLLPAASPLVAWGQRLRACGLTCCAFVCLHDACYITIRSMRPATVSLWIHQNCFFCCWYGACYVALVAWGQRLRACRLICCSLASVDVACYVAIVAWGQRLRACGLSFCACVCVYVACYVTMVAEASACELVDWLAVLLSVWMLPALSPVVARGQRLWACGLICCVFACVAVACYVIIRSMRPAPASLWMDWMCFCLCGCCLLSHH